MHPLTPHKTLPLPPHPLERDRCMDKTKQHFVAEKALLTQRFEQAHVALKAAKSELRQYKGEQEMMYRVAR